MKTQMKIYAYKDFMSRAHRSPESSRDRWGVSSYAKLFLHESGSSIKLGNYSKHLEKVKFQLSRALNKFIIRKSVKPQDKELIIALQSRIEIIESCQGIISFIDTVLGLTSKYRY